MKKQIHFRIIMLLSLAFTFSFIGHAENGNCNSNQFSQDVIITVNDASRIETNASIHVKLEFTVSPNVRSLKITDLKNPAGLNPSDDKVPFQRTEQQKDGKVDVDIIIRGSDLSIYRDPTTTSGHTKLIVFTLDFITVDNISGYNQTQETNTEENYTARIVSTEIISEVNGNQTITNANDIIALDFSNIEYKKTNRPENALNNKLTSRDITLYPNPVRFSTFNLKADLEIGEVQTISVFNALGGLVFQESVSNKNISSYQVNLPSLPSGVYFLNLETIKGQVVKKFNLIN